MNNFETTKQMNNREKGAQKEELVCAYLISEGVRITERNFRCRQGEIDIIGYEGDYLVFFPNESPTS